MKYVFILLSLFFLSGQCFAQTTTNYQKVSTPYQYRHILGDSVLGGPYGSVPEVRQVGGQDRPGLLFYRTTDSTYYRWTGYQWLKFGADPGGGGGEGGWVTLGNGYGLLLLNDSTYLVDTSLVATKLYALHLKDSLNALIATKQPAGNYIGQLVSGNGLNNRSDSTTWLGGVVDSGSVLQVVNVERLGNRNSRILITNDTLSTAQSGWENTYNQGDEYSGELLSTIKTYRESRGDTLNLQYGGATYSLYDKMYDSTSAMFVAPNKEIRLNNMGHYAQARFFPPRDSVDVVTSTFGQTGSLFAAQLGLGDTWGYNINITGDRLGLGIAVNKSEIDFVRNIDATRRKKITGNGLTGYGSYWKFIQSTMNGSTPKVESYISKIYGYYAYGGIYTDVGGALIKDSIFRVAKVDTAVGLWVAPQRREFNEVNSGYGVVVEGEDDYNYLAGTLKVAGTMPTRDNGGQTETVDVTGSVLGSTAVIGGQRVSNNSYLQAGRPDRTKPIYSFGDFLSDAIPGVTHMKDTVGTSYTKKARLLQNDMRYYMNDDYVSFSDAALETNIAIFYVQDSMQIDNASQSATTVAGVRNSLQFNRHSTQTNPARVKQSGTTPAKATAVSNATLVVGSTNIYLDGWYSGYNTTGSSGFTGDTIAHFIGFNSYSDNSVGGHIPKHYGFFAGTIPNADSAFGVYQEDPTGFNLFAGSTKFGNLTVPTATVDITGTLKYVDGNEQNGYVLTSDASGNATWQAPGAGGSVNLATDNLTQDAETRTYDVNGEDLYWENISSMRWYGSGSYVSERLLEIDGGNGISQMGRLSTNVYYEASDSLKMVGVGQITDTTDLKIFAETPGGGIVKVAAGALAGGSSGSVGINDVLATNANLNLGRKISGSGSYGFTMDSMKTFRLNSTDGAEFLINTLGDTKRIQIGRTITGSYLDISDSTLWVNLPTRNDNIQLRKMVTVDTVNETVALVDIPDDMLAVVASDFGLSDVNTAQTAFPSAIDQVTLEGNSTYYFEFHLDMAVGNTPHATGMGFDLGSTTLNWYNLEVMGYAAVANNVGSAQTTSWWTSNTPNSAMMAASAVTGNHLVGWGYMSVNTGGDVTPQVKFSVAPGGTNQMKTGSWMKFKRVGDGSFTTNKGFK